MNRMRIFILVCLAYAYVYALTPCDPSVFFEKVSQSPDIQLGEWNGRGELCMQKAKETGYLMLWYLTALKADPDLGSNPLQFLQNNLCRQAFCDLVNSYKYIILCCEDYCDETVKARKDELYGWKQSQWIKDENTGEYVQNWNGYPTVITSKFGTQHVDSSPSLHLLKFDSSCNIIFHVSGGHKYDNQFSPYADKFPIPHMMHRTKDKFAPWLKQYLDMYPIEEQISEYENAVTTNLQPSGMETNYIYDVVEVAVTETINPTVYQVALHRDNLLFRTVTTIEDILVKRRVNDIIGQFDDYLDARNFSGKWFVNHDDTLTAIAPTLGTTASIDIVPRTSCTLTANQRFGNGFELEVYEMSLVTNIEKSLFVASNGTPFPMLTTNLAIEASSTPSSSTNVQRECKFEMDVRNGKLYRLSVNGNATFDVFSSR